MNWLTGSLLCILLLAFPVMAQAQTRGCTPADLKITVLPITVKHDYTKDSADLFRIVGRPVYGLVTTQHHIRVTGPCSVEVGYVPMQLFISQEIRQNPCVFDWVLKHELGHVAIYKMHLAGITTRIRSGDLSNLYETADNELWKVTWAQRVHDYKDEGHILSVCNFGLVRIFP